MAHWPFLPAPLRVARRFGGPVDPFEVADHRWRIAPAEVVTTPPALFLPEDLDQVTRVASDSTSETEASRVRGGPVEHAATTAVALRDAVIHGGHLYSGLRLHQRLSARPEAWSAPPWVPRRDGDHLLACSETGNRSFGSYLADDLILALLGPTLGRPVRTDDPLTQQQDEYARRARIRYVEAGADRFERLVVVDDSSLNAQRRERHLQLRERLRHSFASASHPGVYLRQRSKAGGLLVNEAELESALTRRGFDCFDPSGLPLTTLLPRLVGARMAVGLDGGQMAHAVHTLEPGGALVCLIPSDRFQNRFKGYADLVDLRYGFSLCTRVAGGYQVHVGRLLHLLDLIDLRNRQGR